MSPINYYRDFRQRVSSLREGRMGEFDPLSGVTTLDNQVSELLRTQDGQSRVTIEPGGSPVVSAFCTYLHETIHWWQRIGSTAGFIHGLNTPAQVRCTTGYLAEIGDSLGKPLVDED